MKIKQRVRCAVSLAVGLVVLTGRAEQSAVVKKDRVNVRAQALPGSEVITQLKKGETVTVIEEITPKKHKRGEPAKWAKIRLPPNTPVWVFAPYVETNNHTVNIKRLNLRAGPGENFSVIGRIDRGTAVKEIRTDGNWMEVEAPANAYAFVAADLLDQSTTAPAPAELAATTNTAPVQPPPVTETVKPDAAPVVAVEPTPTPTTPATTTAQPQPAAATPAVPADTTPAKRVVTREGTVVYSRSIQAPTVYALENKESRRIVNFLHSESEDVSLKKFAGKKVIVSGEELIDQRWTGTPIIEVDSIQVVP